MIIEPQNFPVSVFVPSLNHPSFAISRKLYLLSFVSVFPLVLYKSNVVISVPVVTVALFKISDTAMSFPDVITVWNLKPVGAANLILAPFVIVTLNLMLFKVIFSFTVSFVPGA